MPQRSPTRAGKTPASIALGLATLVLMLSACTAPETNTPSPTPPAPSTGAPDLEGSLRPSGEPRELATGLDVPWSVVPLGGGAALISERDTARVLELTASGELREAGVVEGVSPGGEGGLLGLALSPERDALYAYFTGAGDNRVVRMPLRGDPGALSLGEPEPVFTGIPKAGNHNGGRLAFGPDGMLYVTTGDAGRPERSQDLDSPGGKILRLTPEGAVPDDNPFDDSPVYSLGHRNVQGIAWDADGRLWASEFGQNTWDELNLIEPGGNYGWPEVEGQAGCADETACEEPRFIDPVLQWRTDQASPSGIAIIERTVFIAALRGERLWTVDLADAAADAPVGEPSEWLAGEHGRLRDAVAGPQGTLWLLTNNTARGTPRSGDDRLLQLPLEAGARG